MESKRLLISLNSYDIQLCLVSQGICLSRFRKGRDIKKHAQLRKIWCPPPLSNLNRTQNTHCFSMNMSSYLLQ